MGPISNLGIVSEISVTFVWVPSTICPPKSYSGGVPSAYCVDYLKWSTVGYYVASLRDRTHHSCSERSDSSGLFGRGLW